MMPVLDGFGVLKILNKDVKLHHIPFIFLTAKAEKEDFRKGMSLGAEDYITKPFDDVELLEAIEMRLAKAEKIKSIESSEPGLQHFFSEAKALDQFKKLSVDKEIRHYKAKDLIFEEAQSPHWLYFIISGSVKLYQINDYGKELTTEILTEGDFFGYESLLNETPYENNAAVIEDCSLRLIPKSDFSILLFNNRDFAAKFIKMMSNKKTQTEKKLIEMAYSSVRKKVANALLAFAKNNKSDGQSMQISRDELASMAGTAKETLIRTLSDFKSENLIQIESKTIKIIDLDELEHLIG